MRHSYIIYSHCEWLTAACAILQMEQTEAQLQCAVNGIREQVGSLAQHMEQLQNPSTGAMAGLEAEIPGGGAGRKPTKLPPIDNRPDMPDAGAGGSASTAAHAPPTESSRKSRAPEEPAPAPASPKADGGRKPRQP